MIIEDELNTSWDISEDVSTEENDDQEGANMSTTLHDGSVEDNNDNETNHVDNTNTKNQEHQPLFVTVHNVVQQSLHRVLHWGQHCSWWVISLNTVFHLFCCLVSMTKSSDYWVGVGVAGVSRGVTGSVTTQWHWCRLRYHWHHTLPPGAVLTRTIVSEKQQFNTSSGQ